MTLDQTASMADSDAVLESDPLRTLYNADVDPQPEAVYFDLDDTLFDYTQYIESGLRAAADVVEAETGRDLERELLDLYFEQEVREGTFDRLLGRYDLPTSLVDDMVQAYHERIGPLTPYPAADSVLSALGSEYDLGLITDGKNGHEKLERLDLADHFDVVFVGPEHGTDKRNAVAFAQPLAELDVQPEEAVYVGDNPRTDFRHSNALGMVTVRLLRGRYADHPGDDETDADYVVDSLADLRTLLQ